MARAPPNTVPSGPSASMRTPGAPCAQTSTLKPSGTRSASMGRRFGAVTVKRGACGASGEAAMLSGRPCAQAGAGAGAGAGACWAGDACCARPGKGEARTATRPTAAAAAESRNMAGHSLTGRRCSTPFKGG